MPNIAARQGTPDSARKPALDRSYNSNQATAARLSKDVATEIERRKTEALLQARLDARHGVDRLPHSWVLRICREVGLTPKQVRAAERLGRELRVKGIPCLCPKCGTSTNADIRDRQQVRNAYAMTRSEQLAAAGLQHAQREQIIANEIDAGAAFQTLPTIITRSNP